MLSARFVALAFLLAPTVATAKCIPIEQARERIGDTVCVAGKVHQVKQGNGVFFLDFCPDYRSCPFTAVVFFKNLRDVGDVRLLAGKEIELHGHLREYRGRAEIILRDARQLRGEAAKLPPPPKGYEADWRGNYSAGKFERKKSGRKTGKSARRRSARSAAETEASAGPE